jgi:uncharacterized integral membrane protein
MVGAIRRRGCTSPPGPARVGAPAAGYDQQQMSEQATPQQTEGRPPEKKRSSRELLRTGLIVVVAIYFTLFAVLNLDDVKVDWVVGSGRAPLIIVIVISLLVGIVLTYAAERRSKRGQ